MHIVTLTQNPKNIEVYLIIIEKALDFLNNLQQNMESSAKANNEAWTLPRVCGANGVDHIFEKLDKLEQHLKVSFNSINSV